jgi:hypothetical protein
MLFKRRGRYRVLVGMYGEPQFDQGRSSSWTEPWATST